MIHIDEFQIAQIGWLFHGCIRDLGMIQVQFGERCEPGQPGEAGVAHRRIFEAQRLQPGQLGHPFHGLVGHLCLGQTEAAQVLQRRQRL